jgi:hypothetical protein
MKDADADKNIMYLLLSYHKTKTSHKGASTQLMCINCVYQFVWKKAPLDTSIDIQPDDKHYRGKAKDALAS